MNEELRGRFDDVCGDHYNASNGKRYINDLFPYAPVLKELSSKCDHVTEFGLRWGCSIWALMAGLPKVLRSYDHRTFDVTQIAKCAEDNDIDFKYIVGSVIDPALTIDETDLLFIDTEHTYRQLHTELLLHGDKVRRYMAFHDTEIEKELKPAIDEFLEDHPEWQVQKRHSERCGLTVIKHV